MTVYPAVTILLLAPAIFAQTRGEVGGMGGLSWFLDDGDTRHSVVGGSGRVYLTRRFAVGPELMYMHHSFSDRDVLVLANLVRDFGGNDKVQPYAVLGIGIIHNQNRFIRFNSTEATIGGGFGARIYLTGRLFFAPEMRIGWEPLFQITGSIGYRFGPR